jgi:hypothetical protein
MAETTPTAMPRKSSMLKILLLLIGIASTIALLVISYEMLPGITPEGTDNPLQAETINGFAVPPEPAKKLNNSTLAGVDTNNNGVRDDVERAIAKKVSSVAEFENAIQIAIIYQRVLVMGLSSQADADAFMISVSCAGIRTTETLRRSAIQALILNTSERKNAFRANTTQFDGPIINPDKDCR